jgi:hypothetical protein
MRTYLVNANKPRSRAHIMCGADTACRMLSTGGIAAKESYVAAPTSGAHPICSMCENADEQRPIGDEDLFDALNVMIAAWEAHTTQDALKMIGLSGDITFPAMPSRIRSYADAKRVLLAAKESRK